MKHKINIAEVNCDENGSLCKEQGVEGYPMIFFYHHGHKVDYRGSRSVDALEKFVLKAIAPYVTH
jgi:thioredoxin-like negative regulator of GroEL